MNDDLVEEILPVNQDITVGQIEKMVEIVKKACIAAVVASEDRLIKRGIETREVVNEIITSIEDV